MKVILKDLITSVFFILVATIMYLLTLKIKIIDGMGVDSAFVPKIVVIGLFIFSGLLLINSVYRIWQEKNIGEVISNFKGAIKQKRNVNALFSMVIIIIYAFLIPKLGFLISSILYLFTHFLVLGERKSWKIWLFIFISILVSAFIYYVFRNILQVRLPTGVL